MNKDAEKFKLSDLIARHYLGLCSPSEEKILKKWLQENSQNKILYDQILTQKNVTNKINQYLSFNSNEVYQRIKPQPVQKQRLYTFRRILRYVAIFIIPLLAGGILLWYYNNSQEQEIISMVPGYSKATLTLADGSRIILDSVQNGNIAKQLATNIIKLDNGKLLYSDSISEKGTQHIDKLADFQINTLSIPRGGEFQIILPDSTRVWLNSETVLEFPTRFTGSERKINLKNGEAYFEVAKNKQMPFIININEKAEVKVLGTHFSITAYKDEPTVKTTLVEGSVQVLSLINNHSSFITPGQQASLNTDGTISMQQVNTHLYTAWINGEFVFENASLETVLKKLGRWYDFDAAFENPEAKNYHFSGTLKRYENISQLIELLSYTSKLEFNVKEGVLYVN